jgi:methionyl-tRNA synthetase
MKQFAFHKGLAAVWAFITHMNKYVDVTAPWVLAKDKAARRQLETVIYNLLEGLRIISGLIYPVMPDTAAAMQNHLGLGDDREFFKLERLNSWRRLRAGVHLRKSISLFPRIDPDKQGNQAVLEQSADKLSTPIKPEISLDDFTKIDLRVATVVSATAIPRAKKLLQLEVDLGEQRTIVSGIAGNYTPDDLIGKQVIVVANLKPAKLMGVLSKGMLIAATDDTGVTVATLDKSVKTGTPLS